MMITVAAFDFDGTLTNRDSLLPFFCYISGYGRVAASLCTELPSLLRYATGKLTRQELKEAFLTHFLSGVPAEEAIQLGKAFAREKLPALIVSERWARVQWHLQRGHRCILVSANLGLYLKPWGVQVGFDAVIASECAVTTQGTLSGRLHGKNCRGPEKARRLMQLLGPRSGYTLYAYGDSAGDREMLDLADHPVYV